MSIKFQSVLLIVSYVVSIMLFNSVAASNYIRVYCYGVKQSEVEKYKDDKSHRNNKRLSFSSDKLKKADGNTATFLAEQDAKGYIVTPEIQKQIIEQCNGMLNDKKEMLIDVRATKKSYYTSEKLELAYYGASPVRVQQDGKEWPIVDFGKEKEHKLTNAEVDKILEEVEKNKQEILDVINSDLIFEEVGNAQQSDARYEILSRVYIVTTTLVSLWMAEPLTANATRELFPLVYKTLYGAIPSKLSYEYWLVYMPMREHASAYAYNHARGIISSTLMVGKVIYNAAYHASGIIFPRIRELTSYSYDTLARMGTQIAEIYRSSQAESVPESNNGDLECNPKSSNVDPDNSDCSTDSE